jgi:phosphatidylserine/phosphatidylglycerophosphate/cardiolipin synthase-like enzyme
LIIREIDKALNTIDLAIYSITNERIANKIKEIYDGSIKIRIIGDRLQSKVRNSKFQELVSYGIEAKLNQKHKIEHNKFIVIDDNKVITGSYNYTESATRSNSENCLLIIDETKKYKERFNWLWEFY